MPQTWTIVTMDGIKRKGKLLMGISDLSFVIYEQKCLHEAVAKVLPCQHKAATALLKWAYTESNASIPNLYSCWSDLDYALQMLIQESIDHSVEYRKLFKEINTEGKRLNDIQKDKETSAKKVTSIKKQIENARKSKKGADKVKLGNLEAELSLAQNKDTEIGKLLINKTTEFEEYKASIIRESSLKFCDDSLENLDHLRQVLVAKREVASAMSSVPIYNGDRITHDGMNTVDDVFKVLQLQLPSREQVLDRTRCFGLGTRSSSFSFHEQETHMSATASPKQSRTIPRGLPLAFPSNSSPSMQTDLIGTMGSSLTSGVYQGDNELDLSDYSDDDHDYQIPNDDYFGKKQDTSLESQEEEYLAPQLSEPGPGPRVPPRQEFKHLLGDASAGTSKTPGDYMVVVEDSDHDEPRMPSAGGNSRSSTDSSASSSSTGPGRPNPVKLPRVLPTSNSLENEGEDNHRSPGFVCKSLDSVQKEKEAVMIKRKPAPLPKPASLDKPKLKPKPGTSPGRDKPIPLPRHNSADQDSLGEGAGELYEVMTSADKTSSTLTKDGSALISTYDPEPRHVRQGPYYSQVFERDDDDEDSDYCVAGSLRSRCVSHNDSDDNANFRDYEKADFVRADQVDRTSSSLNNNGQWGSLDKNKDSSDDDEDDYDAIYCNLPS